jgi:hypothetical protein
MHLSNMATSKPFACKMNPSAVKEEPGVCSLLLANIHVDNILAAAAHREIIERLLTVVIKAIFVVWGQPNITVRQCPLSLEK